MAAPSKKKLTKSPSPKAGKKKVKAAIKPAVKKTAAGLKSTKKKTVKVVKAPKKIVAKKKPPAKKMTKPASSSKPMASGKVVIVKRRWFSFFRTSAMILVLAAGAVMVSLDPSSLAQLKASILAQLDTTINEVAEPVEEKKGILLSYETNGVNEQKLLDIFKTVFPETGIQEVNYASEEGKLLVQQLGVSEVPNIYFEKEAFEGEKLSEVVKDLFSLKENYYGLNVSLVNPSLQVKINGSLNSEGGVWVGEKEAPITIYVYSDVKCQHCRVNERNNTSEWKNLVDEGLVQIVYLDLPQDTESTFHSTALNCYYDQTKNSASYLELRQSFFARTNLTKPYTLRELKRLGVNYDQVCDEVAYRALFRNRIKLADAEGITGVPALYIGMTGGNHYVRFTGAKDFEEYRETLDKLLGEVNQETAAE